MFLFLVYRKTEYILTMVLFTFYFFFKDHMMVPVE